MAFSSGGFEKQLKLWDLRTGTQLDSIPQVTHLTGGCAISADGSLLAIPVQEGDGHVIQLMTLPEKNVIRVLRGHKYSLQSIAFSPDGSLIASSSTPGHATKLHEAKVWNRETGKLLFDLKGHHDFIPALAFSPDSRVLATGSRDNTLQLWDTATGQHLKTLDHSAMIWRVAFSPDGQTLAVPAGIPAALHLWSTSSWALEDKWQCSLGDVRAIAFSPSGRTLATGSNDALRLWHVETRTELTSFENFTDLVTSLAFSNDGSALGAAYLEGGVQLWRGPKDVDESEPVLPAGTRAGRKMLSGHRDMVLGVVISPDGRRMVTSGLDGTAIVWDVTDWSKIATLSGHEGMVADLKYTRDGAALVSVGGSPQENVPSEIIVWDTATWGVRRRFSSETWLQTFSFVPGSDSIVTGNGVGEVVRWDIRNGERELIPGDFGKVVSLTHSSTGDLLAIGEGARDSAGGYKLYRRTNDADYVFVRDEQFQETGVRSVCFSPTGQYLLTGCWDGVVRVWEVETGNKAHELDGYTRDVQAMRFSPNGEILATADKSVKLWDWKTKRLLDLLPFSRGRSMGLVFTPGDLQSQVSRMSRPRLGRQAI